MAGYHQFHAVSIAVEETLRATLESGRAGGPGETEGVFTATPMPGGERGDRRVGVVWHTQGSGKSLTMAFYAGRIILHPRMANPTIVVITDRNDLDDQLFGTFARCRDLLRQAPVQAADRADLREQALGRRRRRGVHDDPEVLPRGASCRTREGCHCEEAGTAAGGVERRSNLHAEQRDAHGDCFTPSC